MSLIAKRFISYVGKVKLEHFTLPGLRSTVETYCDEQEKRDPRIKKADIKGTKLHKSHEDPTDDKDVITIKFLDENDKRVGTGHLHKDGTSKFRHKQKPLAPSNGFEEVE